MASIEDQFEDPPELYIPPELGAKSVATEATTELVEPSASNAAALPLTFGQRLTNGLNSSLVSWLALLIAGVIALFHYVRTLEPGVGATAQSISLQTAIAAGGVLASPGYELYLLLGQLFGRIPLPQAALTFLAGLPSTTRFAAGYQVNLFSAVSSVLAIILVGRITHRLTRNVLISFFTALLLAASLGFWQQAVYANIFSLSTLLVAATFVALIAWMQTRFSPYYFASGFLLALTIGLNPAALFLLPAWLWAVLVTDSAALFTTLNFVLLMFFIVIAYAVHLYAPLISIVFGPTVYCVECPTAFSDLPAYLLTDRWASLLLGSPVNQWLVRWSESGALLSAQFSPLGMIVGGMGLWYLLQRSWRIGTVFLLALGGAWLFVIMTVSAEWPQQMTTLYALFVPLIGVGLFAIWEAVRDALAHWTGFLRQFTRLVLTILLLAIPIGLIAATFNSNYRFANRAQNTVVHTWARDLLNSAETNPWILTPPAETDGDLLMAAFQYVAYREYDDVTLTVVPQSSQADLSTQAVYAIELNDERLTQYVLNPVLRSDGETIAYQLVGSRDAAGVVTPWVSAEKWNEIQSTVLFP